METEKENRLDTLKNLALDELIAFFQKPENSETEIMRADKATDSLSSVSRIMATERVKEATKLNIIKTITDDPAARAKYIEMTLPQYFPQSVKSLK